MPRYPSVRARSVAASGLLFSTTLLMQDAACGLTLTQPASREVDLAPVGGASATTAPKPIISEGAIVTMLPGTLIWDAKGGLIFRPDSTRESGTSAFTQSASLLPCAALARFESMLGVGVSEAATNATAASPPNSARSSKDGNPVPENPLTRELGRYYINGQVFAFHGRPYIMLSVPPTTTPAEPAAAPKPATPEPNSTASGVTPSATPTAASPLSESTDVQSLITELETRRTTARALETAATLAQAKGETSTASGGATPSSPTGATAANRPDGQHINGRQGRVVRHDAWLIFTPDSGTSSPSDPPLVLLPSAQMERLEGLVFRYGDAARYRISGKLVSYNGRQFLLPTLAQVMPPSDLSPAQ